MKNPATESLKIITLDAAQTEKLGEAIAKVVQKGTVFFSGDLGAGKTTLCRGVVSALGYDFDGSPTYALLSPYENGERAVYHWDLYRLESAEDFLARGLTDLQTQSGTHLVEWPEKLTPALLSHYPEPHYQIQITKKNEGREVVFRQITPDNS
jgi:tRNA threonylcarbamoyladenosine biosynthesis protein TsaE